MKISLKIDSSRVLSYARMQNGHKVVNGIVIRNLSTENLSDVRLAFSFDPDYAESCELAIGDIPAKGKRTIDDVNIVLSPSYLANLLEKLSGVMNVAVLSSGEEIYRETVRMTILPYDHWEGSNVSAEMLASFVVPNHPAVKKIAHAASDKLFKWTGNPSMDEYQSGDMNRVKYQMAAIYEAIRDLKITYAAPPASFYETGQRVRLPEEIISTGFATCLDFSLLYASCLESVGLKPIIAVHSSHAYAGAWLVDTSSPYPVNDDPAALRKRNADGIKEMIVLEMTDVCKGVGKSFDEAMADGEGHLGNEDDFCYFLDIAAARKLGINPVPLRVMTDAGYAIEEAPSRGTGTRPEELSPSDVIQNQGVEEMDKQLVWERKLLDLTARNNLVNIHPRSILQIMSSDIQSLCTAILDGKSMKVLSKPDGWEGTMMTRGIFAPLTPVDVMSSYTAGEVGDGYIHTYHSADATAAAVDNIRLGAKHSIEETGANTLYLTLGNLRWHNQDDENVKVAPVILIPVEITRSTGAISWNGEEPMVNLTLLEMLRQQHDIIIGGLNPLPEKNSCIDVQLVLNTIRRAVMDKKGWDVDNLVFLGNFTFNKFVIWNDIHSNRQMLDANPVVSSLKNGRLDPRVTGDCGMEGDIDSLCPAEDILLPISADSSQIKAISEAVSGKTFIMHGPPGTGKSQTITNIIANALYRGQRVLFVSEKKAALEVVQSRLESIGLAPFCLELHSSKARKTTVLGKMEATLSMEKPAAPETFGSEADSVNELRTVLNSHVHVLHERQKSGLTLYECISSFLSYPQTLPSRRIPFSTVKALTPSSVRILETAVKDFCIAAGRTGIDQNCGLLDMPVKDYSPDWEEELRINMETLSAQKSFLSFYLKARKLQRILGADIGVAFSSASSNTIRAKVSRWLSSLDSLRMYAIYNNQRAVLRSKGLGLFCEAYESGDVSLDNLQPFFWKSLYRSFAEQILSQETGMNLFCGEMFESRIDSFRELDSLFVETTRQEIVAGVASSLPDLEKEATRNPEVAILKKAFRNNARGMSLRKLFDRIPNLLPRVCPCMLMSPLSVSQYLQPENDLFDLVIFDEASQMQTSEAVAAIARGRNLVVVGDPRQLPPTSFFENRFFDEDNAEMEDLESILDDCLALSIPSNHLRWHYRSRHESLIAFSNANYYENRLLTFPSNDDLACRVSFHKVDGIYDRGRTRQNVIEAEAVAAEVCRLLKEEAGRSIGVITFSVTQQQAIEKMLEALFKKNPGLEKKASAGDEPLFVKSLENVQGDERDIILFSIGYGMDKMGHMTSNFGPLNQDGGWRRLNVAVSRSRYAMKVFSSVEPDRIKIEATSPRGVKDLKAFLEYARDGRESLDEKMVASARNDAYAERVAEDLRSRGFEVNTSIGSSEFRIDIGVVDPANPDRYLYGIICDGPNYASAQAAKDREIIRPQVLEELGWKIERKWIMDDYR